MKVYSLVGESGSGKSYRALELAYENDIEYIIDDGILIYKNKILEGLSAKQAKTVMGAIKRAIFNDEWHMKCVRSKIKEEKIDKILVLGTSDKMIKKIIKRLDLGELHKTVYIRDISSEIEISIAKEYRKKGKHTIPLPSVEVKQIASGLSINSLRKIFRKKNNKCKMIEKTIIRPTFSYIGKYYINKSVIEQIVRYEVSKFNRVEKIYSLYIENKNNNINVKINLYINDISQIKEINILQNKVKYNLEKITMLNIECIDIVISKLIK